MRRGAPTVKTASVVFGICSRRCGRSDPGSPAAAAKAADAGYFADDSGVAEAMRLRARARDDVGFLKIGLLGQSPFEDI